MNIIGFIMATLMLVFVAGLFGYLGFVYGPTLVEIALDAIEEWKHVFKRMRGDNDGNS